MGHDFVNLSRRMTVAPILLAVAVLVPTIAWYVSGTRNVARRVDENRASVLEGARQSLVLHAEILAARLERLRFAESERPFYHYQSLYHDPRGAAEGLSVAPSPLAAGIQDPLVKAYFQIDASGSVTMPTVNERFPELSAEEGFAVYCAFLETLRQGHVIAPSEANGLGQSPVDVRTTNQNRALEVERHLILKRKAWQQNLQANSVYGALTGRAETSEDRGVVSPKNAENDSVVIGVGPLRWSTLVFGSGSDLVSLREITTPQGVLVQGFAIDIIPLLQDMLEQGIEADFGPAVATPLHQLEAPVGQTGWALFSDAAPFEATVTETSAELTSEFRGRFLFTTLTAILAAATVIFILAQTERLARQRARFAAAAAHELKTPIASLRLHAEMLRDGLGNPEKHADYVRQVADESARLGRVVTNMLDLARLERGALSVSARPGNITEAVEAVIHRHRHTHNQADIEFNLEADGEGARAVFDRDALDHILDNLLDNAEKHTRGQESRSVRVTISETDDFVHVNVIDSGPGIPRRLKEVIFEPFDRGTRSQKAAGLGLGLSIARALARAQDGNLEVVNAGGPGAHLRLSLQKNT
jgi:signal transduction histidine kinase